MSLLLLNAEAILTDKGLLPKARLLVEKRLIKDLWTDPAFDPSQESQAPDTLDLTGLTLVPGFVDVHVQGCLGVDVWEKRTDALFDLSRNLAQFGTTSFLVTTTYDPIHVPQLAAACRERLPGARALGIHLEGPFLSRERLGAIPQRAVEIPCMDRAREIVHQCDGLLKMMTLAPELPGALDVAEFLLEQGVTVSLGHSATSFEQAQEAFQRGISHVTHLFNAMSLIHHRAPSASVAALLQPEVTVEVVPDGIHLHPAMVDLIFRIKGPKRVAIITDAVRAAGMPDGEYPSGEHGEKVRLSDGSVRLEDGTLAGSALTMDKAVRQSMEYATLSLQQAIQSAVQTPMASLGLKRPAFLGIGLIADIVGLNAQGQTRFCMVAGEVVRSQ